jgi:HEAT repeat protein
MIRLSSSSDSAVRYWSVVALSFLGSGASQTVKALTGRLGDSSPNVRFAAAGALCKLGLCDNALPVLAEGLGEQREETVLYAAREIQGLGSKARPIVQQLKDARQRCRDADGEYINNNHATFIDWALKNALENCGESSN